MSDQFDNPVIEIRTIDGDTQSVLVDLGYRVSMRVTTRLTGIDAPERGTDAGKAVTAVVDSWLRSAMREQYQLRLISQSLDKYGRSICDFVDREGWESLTQFLLRVQIVRSYDGSARREWSQRELADVLTRATALVKISGDG